MNPRHASDPSAGAALANLPVVGSARRALAMLAAVLTMLGMLTAFAAPSRAVTTLVPAPAGVQNPPSNTAASDGAAHNIIVFPQRDFVSASGYSPGDVVNVFVIEPDTGRTWATDPDNPPVADDTGLIEVNHPGGACWFTGTPDIRAGDIVQIDVIGGPDNGQSDATTVRHVTAKRPVKTADDTIQVHGTADDGAGNPLPVAELEQRIVAPGNIFALSGKRTLRAVSAGTADGTLSYDAPGSTAWTATYSGMSPEDVTLALGAESRGMWLGPTLTETTVYEIGALTVGGPAAPCTAPLEVRPPPAGTELIPPSAPTELVGTQATPHANSVTLTWTASTDNVGVTAYGILRDGQVVFTVSNPDGSVNPPTTFVERNLVPGRYTFTVVALDEAGNVSDPSNVAGPFDAGVQVAGNAFPVPVNDPPSLPINIIVFPSRDFISPSGYLESDTVTVQLLRKNAEGDLIVVSSADGIVPTDGFAEVNHPGGACWAGLTPDIRVGDVVRTIAYNPTEVPASDANPDSIRSVDQTTVSGITAFQPTTTDDDPNTAANDGTAVIHGSALGHDGKPLPVDQLEQRMIATHGVGLWDLNGRRALRADSAGAGDGVLQYDTTDNPMGIKWTATYTGLDQADVDRFADADTRAHWLGRDPLLLNEATIFENAPGANPPGPAGPGCTRPLEAIDVSAPTVPGGFTAQQAGADSVTLSWTASSDDWSVAGYRIYQDGTAVANTTDTTITLNKIKAGPHTYAVTAYDTASPRGAGATPTDQIASGLGKLYGNESDPTPTIDLIQRDVTAPSVPTDLTVKVTEAGIGQSNGKVELTWTASTDDVGVTAYRVSRQDVLNGPFTPLVPDVTTTTLTDTGLAVGTYTYRVEALDAAGNLSLPSASVTADVPEEKDTVAPSVPSNVVATTDPDVHGKDVRVTWDASADNVGVTNYRVYRQRVLQPANSPAELVATVNGATTLFLDANLPVGTYLYTVDALDSAGNHSLQSDLSTPQTGAVVANDPPPGPHSLIAFPARDFISATGYAPNTAYTFTLIRGGQTYVSQQPFTSDGTGLIEVNHPGGTCWILNTPDMRPGDVIRITDDATGIADQTTVSAVTVERPVAGATPGTVIVKGTASDGGTGRLPIDQIENRLVTGTASSFDLNGARTLRAASAGADGTLAYDGVGPAWTATYTGLTENDVLRAVGGTNTAGTAFPGAESRAVWLGRVPLALTEATIFENGPGVIGGPSGGPCQAPTEPNRPAASLGRTSIPFPATDFRPVQTDSAPVNVLLSNGGGVPLTINNIYFAGRNPGDFRRANPGPLSDTCPTNFPAQLAANTSCTLRLIFKPTALGLRQANISISDNAANTTDQTVALTGRGIDSTAPIVSVLSASPPFGTVNGGQTTSRVFTVTNTSLDPDGIPLQINPVTAFTGTNPGDFSVTNNQCTGSYAAGQSCTITVQFAPGGRGARSANLVLSHNTTRPIGSTTTTVVLNGATGGNGAVLGFKQNPVTFGSVNRGTTKDQTVTLGNTGNQSATLNLASFGVTGAGYSVVSTTCGTLAANGSCNVVVRFASPAGNPATFAGTLTVTAANGMPVRVNTALSATSK